VFELIGRGLVVGGGDVEQLARLAGFAPNLRSSCCLSFAQNFDPG